MLLFTFRSTVSSQISCLRTYPNQVTFLFLLYSPPFSYLFINFSSILHKLLMFSFQGQKICPIFSSLLTNRQIIVSYCFSKRYFSSQELIQTGILLQVFQIILCSYFHRSFLCKRIILHEISFSFHLARLRNFSHPITSKKAWYRPNIQMRIRHQIFVWSKNSHICKVFFLYGRILRIFCNFQGKSF